MTSEAKREPGTAPWTSGPVLGPAPHMDLPAARRYCAGFVAARRADFPLVLGLFPRERREALAAAGAFAHTAAEFAGEPVFSGRRELLLDAWEESLRLCFSGEATHPVFVALRATAQELTLEPRPFHELLGAIRRDRAFQSRGLPAEPWSGLVLHVLGVDGRGPWSERLVVALRLAGCAALAESRAAGARVLRGGPAFQVRDSAAWAWTLAGRTLGAAP